MPALLRDKSELSHFRLWLAGHSRPKYDGRNLIVDSNFSSGSYPSIVEDFHQLRLLTEFWNDPLPLLRRSKQESMLTYLNHVAEAPLSKPQRETDEADGQASLSLENNQQVPDQPHQEPQVFSPIALVCHRQKNIGLTCFMNNAIQLHSHELSLKTFLQRQQNLKNPALANELRELSSRQCNALHPPARCRYALLLSKNMGP
jgi:hypothetical protein